jgi:phage gp45-like
VIDPPPVENYVIGVTQAQLASLTIVAEQYGDVAIRPHGLYPGHLAVFSDEGRYFVLMNESGGIYYE